MLRLEIFIPLVYILAAVFYALLGLYAWRKRPAAGVVSFAWAMLSMSVWAFTYGLEIFFPLLETKLLIVNIEYIGIVCVPVFLLFFALDYTGKSHLLTRQVRLLMWLPPVATLLLVWTNPLHRLMWDMETVIQIGALSILNVRFGAGFWLHIFSIFAMATTASILLIMDFLQRPGVLRVQISLVIFGILFSLFGVALFVSQGGPVKGLDVSSLFFLPAAIGLAWATLQYRLSEILSIEHITILKNMRDSVIVLNEQKRVLYINRMAELLLDNTEDNVIGQPFHKVAGFFAEALESHLSGGEHRVEIQAGAGDEAQTFEVAVSSIPTSQHNTWNTVISLHDVTERKEREEELSRRGSIMSAIGKAAEQFLKTTDWEHNISDVLANLGQATDVSRVFVVTNKEEAQTIIASIQYEWTAPGVASQINNPAFQRMELHTTGFGKWAHLLSKGQVVYSLIKHLPEPEANLFRPLGSLSIVVAPVLVDGQWWASIVLDEVRNERAWTEMELEAFRTAASILGAAESRARTAKKLFRRQLTMGLLQDIVSVSLQAASMNEMAEVVVNRLAELVRADRCFLTLWEEAGERTIPLAAYGNLNQPYSSHAAEPGEVTFTESALKLEKTLVVEDVSTTPYASRRITDSFPSKSILVLPLIAMDKKLGAVLVGFDKPHHFESEEIMICKQAAALIALALEKFLAVEEARQRADTSETLRKASMAIVEKLEMDQTVIHILEQLKQVVPYDSASVQLIEGDKLVIVGGHGWEDMRNVIGLHFPIPGDNPNCMVVQSGEPLVISEPWKTYKNFIQPPHDHIRSWLGVPLKVREKIIGLLAIDSLKPENFKEAEVNIAAEFASQVSIALENARIFQETQVQAVTDPLTGLHNRRGFFDLGEVEFSRALSLDRPISAIMLDLDHFKQINDTDGHAVGDVVLHEFAKRCRSCIREIDLIGRYGGEEVIILLPDTHLKAGVKVAERLRSAIIATPVKINNEKEVHITASLGVACKDENTTSLDMLITRADQAMYIAKHNGRNRVAVSR